jgi:2-C-methyl-D-erythritol 4-phosphate cytidylyltransferase
MQLYGVDNTKVFELTLYALIPAAGAGSRFRGEIPKQYLPLAGKPMLWHAVNSLSAAPIENVFVVLAPLDKRFAQLDWSAFGARLQPLYCGGETRRDTVYNGMVPAEAGSGKPYPGGGRRPGRRRSRAARDRDRETRGER